MFRFSDYGIDIRYDNNWNCCCIGHTSCIVDRSTFQNRKTEKTIQCVYGRKRWQKSGRNFSKRSLKIWILLMMN